MKYLYGPVPSRRLGSSLGVDRVPHKACSFDCIYCQLGPTTEKTTIRHLNTVVRPPAEDYARPLTSDRIDELARLLGAEVIADFKKGDASVSDGNRGEMIANLLKRRPCTVSDISSSLGFHENEDIKYVEKMMEKGIVGREKTGSGVYYFGVVK